MGDIKAIRANCAYFMSVWIDFRFIYQLYSSRDDAKSYLCPMPIQSTAPVKIQIGQP